jgi:hypothetical protein
MRAVGDSRSAPWAGLVAGAAGWALHQQVFADMLHFDCHLGDTFAGLAAGAAILVVLAGAGFVSWQSSRAAASHARRFIGVLGAMAAAVFAFAIALQTIASALLPGCGP